jgi:hypothetical protein
MSFRIGSFVAAAISETEMLRGLPKSGDRRGPADGLHRSHSLPEASPSKIRTFLKRTPPGRPERAIAGEPREN